MNSELVYALVFGSAWFGRHMTDTDQWLLMGAGLGVVLAVVRWTFDAGRGLQSRARVTED